MRTHKFDINRLRRVPQHHFMFILVNQPAGTKKPFGRACIEHPHPGLCCHVVCLFVYLHAERRQVSTSPPNTFLHPQLFGTVQLCIHSIIPILYKLLRILIQTFPGGSWVGCLALLVSGWSTAAAVLLLCTEIHTY